MANVNNRITSTKQVWIVVHEDHYFKHLFYDMNIKCSYTGSKMVGVKITFHDQYQNEVHTLNVDTDVVSQDVVDKRIQLCVCVILDTISNVNNMKKLDPDYKNPLHDPTEYNCIKEIIRAANEIASTDSKDQEISSKIARLRELTDFSTREILYIKAKTSDFDNNLVIDNRDDEYKARQKTSFGSEAKAKEILGVDELQDPLVKARSRGQNNKQLLDIKDLTFTGEEDFTDENMPDCIRYPILEALRKTNLRHFKLEDVSSFEIHMPGIKSVRGKSVDEISLPEFIYNAILELCDTVRPKDLVVYKWSNGLIVLQVGSWLVNAEYIDGVVVYGDAHKEYKLQLLLTRYLSDNALKWDEYFDVEIDSDKTIYKPLSEFNSHNTEHIKLEIMTGTEFICKCGKPKDIKMCFAVDGVDKEDKVYTTEVLHRECREVMKAYSGMNWFKSSVNNAEYDGGPDKVHKCQLDLQTSFIKIKDFDILKDSDIVNMTSSISADLNNCYIPWHNVRDDREKTIEAGKEYVDGCKKIVESEAYTKLQDEMTKVIEKTWSKIPGYEE